MLAIGAAGYLLFFVALRKTDVSWMLPTRRLADSLQQLWPDMPFFSVRHESTPQGDETLYTVPTRQVTPQEMQEMGMTNAVVEPAASR